MKISKSIKISFTFIFILFSATSCLGQSYIDSIKAIKKIDNSDFPKVLIYDASQLPITFDEYVKMGFDYVNPVSLKSTKNVASNSLYILWTGIAYNGGKGEWAKKKSPFIKDINEYPNFWDKRLNYYKRQYNNNNKFGIIILDIESRKSNEELDKNPPLSLSKTRKKTDAITKYKSAMLNLYSQPLIYAKKHHNDYKLWSSYGDVPIPRNWWGISKQTWNEWTTNSENLNYITQKFEKGKVIETKFSKELDFYAVSAYYFYNPLNYNSSTANQYLAYMLFQLEANQAWSGSKPIYLYQSFTYYGEKSKKTLVDEKVVKNSVIFALISGAEGLILFNDSHKETKESKYYSLISSYVNSIALLNNYRNYFVDNNVTYYKPDNARDLFTKRLPAVRGIVKSGKMLVAATNPFAEPNQITKIPISYNGKHIVLQLKGTETYLNEIIL